MKLRFRIDGNQENPVGNPIPYLRVTQKMLWLPASHRYMNWKSHVQAAYLKAIKDFRGLISEEDLKILDAPLETPIDLGNRAARMELHIFWKDEKRGDADNIFKGIADALFKNDKNVEGGFKNYKNPDKAGAVIVDIELLKEIPYENHLVKKSEELLAGHRNMNRKDRRIAKKLGTDIPELIEARMWVFFPVIFDLNKKRAYVPSDDWRIKYGKWVLVIISWFTKMEWYQSYSVRLPKMPIEKQKECVEVMELMAKENQ